MKLTALLVMVAYWPVALFLSFAATSVPCPQGADCKSAALALLWRNLGLSIAIFVVGIALFGIVLFLRRRPGL